MQTLMPNNPLLREAVLIRFLANIIQDTAEQDIKLLNFLQQQLSIYESLVLDSLSENRNEYVTTYPNLSREEYAELLKDEKLEVARISKLLNEIMEKSKKAEVSRQHPLI